MSWGGAGVPLLTFVPAAGLQHLPWYKIADDIDHHERLEI